VLLLTPPPHPIRTPWTQIPQMCRLLLTLPPDLNKGYRNMRQQWWLLLGTSLPSLQGSLTLFNRDK
jgi:hypothetical protein